MSEYAAARQRTRARIENAFWDLYLEKDFRRVSVKEIVERAGIHRSTFYMHYNAVEDIFSSIKDHQLQLLEKALAVPGTGEFRFIALLNALRDIYEQNRKFLKPLVIDYHSSAFSRAYRQMLKDSLKRDGAFPDYPPDSREFFVLDCVMSGFIEQLLQCLDQQVISMEESFRLAYTMMELGTKPALQELFGIVPDTAY